MCKIPRRCLQPLEKSLEHFHPHKKPPLLLRRTTKRSWPSLNSIQSRRNNWRRSLLNPSSRNRLDLTLEPKVRYNNTSKNNNFCTSLKTPIRRRAMRSRYHRKKWNKNLTIRVMSSFQGLENFLIVDRFKKKKMSD
jgi:hypothetical protein